MKETQNRSKHISSKFVTGQTKSMADARNMDKEIELECGHSSRTGT